MQTTEIKTNAHVLFTSEYFHEEVLKLYDLMGTKDFWKKDHQLAIKAIMHTYFQSPVSEQSATTLKAVLIEYDYRRDLMEKA